MPPAGGTTGNHDAERAHAVAAAGTSGGGAPLPHLDKIQRSFGRHDVRHVRAHQDAAAAQATEALGAEAYATGDSVAFAGSPSLHTAAHEAAHIVQQKAGVQLAGGIGAEGDTYEKQADAVADRVVAGESAEALLDTVAGERAGGAAVQRTALQLVTKVKVPGRRVGQLLEMLTLEEIIELISQLEGKSAATYTIEKDKIGPESTAALLERAKKQRQKLEQETKPNFNMKNRAVGANGIVLTDNPEFMGIASQDGYHIASASNKPAVMSVFGNQISVSAGGKAPDDTPDVWKVLLQHTQDGRETTFIGNADMDLRGPRKNAADLKDDKKFNFKRPSGSVVTQTFLITEPCKRGDESKSRDAAMGNLNALNYARLAKLAGAQDTTWEWLHLIAASIGGGNIEGNLVAGTFDANTLMIPFEKQVVNLSQKASTQNPLKYTVQADLWDGTWVARYIRLKLEHQGGVIFSFGPLPATQTSPVTQLEYEYMNYIAGKMAGNHSQ